jgi:hypothetical protein
VEILGVDRTATDAGLRPVLNRELGSHVVLGLLHFRRQGGTKILHFEDLSNLDDPIKKWDALGPFDRRFL